MFAAARFYELQASGLGQDFLHKIELALQELVKSPEQRATSGHNSSPPEQSSAILTVA
jgi:hypothetical protein